jgi:putative ABC transport system substrate-binding protein
MRRRDLIKNFLYAATAWPLSAHAQQTAVPVIGFLSGGGERAFAPMVAGFIRGLKETGFTDGQNVLIDYRWAEGDYDRLPAMANELARRPVTVLVASGGTVAARAAKAATKTIPIVFSTADDPVANGLITSLNRPGANITGVAFLSAELAGKRLGLVRELIPQAKLVALLVNAGNPEMQTIIKDTQDAASSVGIRVVLLDARTQGDIDVAFKCTSRNSI